jgi:tetratricopeptide (TPR) repeat protein
MRTAVAALILLIAATAQAEDLNRARQYFNAGVEAYDQGKYEVALREFQHAHALSHNAALYFNMAACEEHMDHYQAASLLLRQYLIEKPEAEDKKNVELRIKSLEERDERLHKMEMDKPIRTAEPVVAPKMMPLQPIERPKRLWTWVMVGVTGALLVTTIGVGAYAVTEHSNLKNSCGMTAVGCSGAQLDGLRSITNATDGLIGVAAVSAVITVVLAIIEPKRLQGRRSDRARLTPAGLVF